MKGGEDCEKRRNSQSCESERGAFLENLQLHENLGSYFYAVDEASSQPGEAGPDFRNHRNAVWRDGNKMNNNF